MTDSRLRGVGTALVTPFRHDGRLDEAALRALVDWQVAEGIQFLVPCGSTGEAATLAPDEHRRVVEIVVEQVAGRVPVCAGAGGNDTRKAIALSREMEAIGATHLLHVSPAYSKPPQRGIEAHFRAIADAVSIPIVLYNVPGRTASNIEPQTTLSLASVPNIAAVKEASGDIGQITRIINERPQGFAVLSGDDELTLEVMRAGGDGVISVISNAVPRLFTELVTAAGSGNFDRAAEAQERLLPIMRAAFVESNPIPIKAAMSMLGRCENILRLPLVPMEQGHDATLRSALTAAGALK
ncbi:MAG: 4-hydroxy-tetrahydrodipicolinate synthase [Gemmatimonadaceae bacterium]|nr:4-hydroxy-tetrahydrodipicolinate synthase [Gemmatimonadaceae bacterium]